MSEKRALIVYCTVPNTATGKKIAKTVVEEGLCACVNLIPGVTSFYIYEEQFCEESEELLIIKTDSTCYKALEKRLLEIHPYEVPEIIASEITDGSDSYMDWLRNSLKPL